MNGFRARFCALVAQQLRAPLPAGKKGAKDRGTVLMLYSACTPRTAYLSMH
jgi:hypothetical protein